MFIVLRHLLARGCRQTHGCTCVGDSEGYTNAGDRRDGSELPSL